MTESDNDLDFDLEDELPEDEVEDLDDLDDPPVELLNSEADDLGEFEVNLPTPGVRRSLADRAAADEADQHPELTGTIGTLNAQTANPGLGSRPRNGHDAVG